MASLSRLCESEVPPSLRSGPQGFARTPPWPHRLVRAGDVTLSVVDHGPVLTRRTDTLLLVHGGHGCWVHWRANIDALSQDHRVVVPDLPCFGGSEDLREPSVEGMALALAALGDSLNLANVTVVAFSFGSLVATAMAAQRPELVRRLMLINPPGLAHRSPETLRLHAEASEVASAEGVRAGVRYTLQNIMLCGPAAEDEACIDAVEASVRCTRFRSREVSRAADLLTPLGKLNQPVHVLLGADDPSHRAYLNERRDNLARVRGASCSTVVGSARHWLQHDQPRCFHQVLREFQTDRIPAAYVEGYRHA